MSVDVSCETRKGPEEGKERGGRGRAAEHVTGKQTQGTVGVEKNQQKQILFEGAIMTLNTLYTN